MTQARCPWWLDLSSRREMRILYHAINGTGLGHLMRLSAIAESVHASKPDVHQLIATSANYEPHIRRLRVPVVVLPRDDSGAQVEPDKRIRTVTAELGGRLLRHLLREYDPDVVVFDTHAQRRLVLDAAHDGRQTVLVLRSCRPELLTDSLDSGRLADFSLVLVPYGREEFWHSNPPELLERLEALGTVRYIGGIAFPLSLDADAIDDVARSHGIPPESTLVLVTAGSGGYEPLNREFMTTACRAAHALADSLPDVRTVCVGGPYADGFRPPAGCAYIRAEPLMQLLIARSDLTVAHAGYNSTQEILRTGARAVLVPIHRSAEDQSVLANYLARRGRVHVVDPMAPESTYLRTFLELLEQPRPEPEPVSGAEAAADAILRLAAAPTHYVCSDRADHFPFAVSCPSPGELAGEILASGAPAVVRIDWDRVQPLLERLGPEVHSLAEGIEVDLGDVSIDEWEWRARVVHDTTAAFGLDRSALVLSVDDPSGGRRLFMLAERISELHCRALVARVPQEVFVRDPTALVESANACRRLAARFTIDITVADGGFVSVDQP
jgi:predicted glycosyltransferase